jgi:pyruvate,water dikinase
LSKATRAGRDEGGKFVLDFEHIGINDVSLVGGKSASLGEMIQKLGKRGVQVPGGFAITAHAYRHFVDTAGIRGKMEKILHDLDTLDVADLQKKGKQIRELFLTASFPADLRQAILGAYGELCERYGGGKQEVAVRSSATAEDLAEASFAGQQDTFLNVRGLGLLDSCRRCFASLFTDRAISYRAEHGFDHMDVALSIAVQKMVRSDAASSGVIFSIDTESGFKDVVLITAAYGLGENIVQGKVCPDEYYVFKPTLRAGKKPIIGKKLGDKRIRMIYSTAMEGTTENVDVSKKESEHFALADHEILKLAEWACIIEDHYSEVKGRFTPMDIEWAKDGDGIKAGTGQLFIVQARPETVHSRKDVRMLRKYVLKEKGGKLLVQGQAVGERIAHGEVNIITNVSDMGTFRKGQVLVTQITDPDWEPIMKLAAAIVTDKGGRTCHAAIVSRELGIACIVGTGNATSVLRSGMPVTVDCSQGERGSVLTGILPFEVEELNLETIPATRTKILMNAGIPEQAFSHGQIPCDGVGLAREEFIINSYIGIHPMALIDFYELRERSHTEPELRSIVKQIDERTRAYDDKVQFFVDNLAHGIARIAAAFYPREVIVRLSDFKTNEYANLLGGSLYEPVESNPMIGWRGASRYYDPRYEPAFGLECRSIKKVREEMGLTNVKVMVPFCRTVAEGKKVLATMAKYDLRQHDNGLEVYMMVEIPSNVILLDEFSSIFDGFSIGSNDLTQLTLGLDRDSELVAHIYDERNEAVMRLLRQAVEVARSRGRKIGICGQAPSDYPELAKFLVQCGIDSLSLNSDTVIKTRLFVAKTEADLGIDVKEGN